MNRAPVSIVDMYDRVVGDALERSSRIAPIATGLTASIDDIYLMDEARTASLSTAASHASDDTGSGIARRVIDRITSGRGGEIVTAWPDGPAWLTSVLGQPDSRQIGGNAAQASWALATVGAPSVLALRDRSRAQLRVLDPRILLAGDSTLAPVSQAVPTGAPTKWPHGVLEFKAGVPLGGAPVPRSTRVMLRFSHEPLETDEGFAAYARRGHLQVAMLSGLATQPDFATADCSWAVELADGLTRSGAFVHHELSEFADTSRMCAAMGVLPATSVGLSLSELAIAVGSDRDPAARAADLAGRLQVDRVVVHADAWALLVTKDPNPATRAALVLGNALASARARHGRPSDSPFVTAGTSFTDDHPAEGPVHDGWSALVVPAPYRRHPAATVGLGDTFVAGLLLGEALDRSPYHQSERHSC